MGGEEDHHHSRRAGERRRAAARAQEFWRVSAAGHRHRPLDGRSLSLCILLGHRRPPAIRCVRPAQPQAHRQGADRRHCLARRPSGRQERPAGRRPANGRGQPRWTAGLFHEFALRRDRPAVLRGRVRRLDGQARRQAWRRHRLRSEILHRVAEGPPAAPGKAAGRRLLVGLVLLSVTAMSAPAELWPWLALAGLGLFHGINPAMGWLFAVALGLNRGSRRVVLLSLVPIALGHAAAVAAVLLAVLTLGLMLDHAMLMRAAAVLLIGWALWHAIYGHRQRLRVGMQTGLAGLVLWSFLMASAHGAGLMLVPILLPICASAAATSG